MDGWDVCWGPLDFKKCIGIEPRKLLVLTGDWVSINQIAVVGVEVHVSKFVFVLSRGDEIRGFD